MSNDIDLGTALNMFKQGVQEFGAARAIGQANDYVQQLKTSDMNEQQKRAELQNVANQLTTHLAQAGTPATTIQAVAGAIGPKQFGSADAMLREGLLTGNQGLQSAAKSEMDTQFQLQNKATLAMIKAQSRMPNPLQAAQFQALQDERATKHATDLDKRIDTQTTRFGNVAKLQGALNQIQDTRTMLQGDLTGINLRELAVGLDRIISQSAPTVSGSHALEPNTIKQMIAKSKEFLTGDPQKIDIPAFKEFYSHALGRIESVHKGIISGAQQQVLKSATGFAKQFPEQFKTYAESRGFKAEVDPKSGRIKTTGIVPDDAATTQKDLPTGFPVSRYLE
jgi:hypothetical protein